MLEYHYYDADHLGAHAAALREIEREIYYPIGGGELVSIDHGADYTAFFRSLGDAHFVVATDGSRVVGGVAAALRDAYAGSRRFQAGYVGDLKVDGRYRGRGLPRRLLGEFMLMTLRRRSLRQWKMAYYAAMHGERGDVSRAFTTSSVHPGRLARRIATLHLYFESPANLALLDLRGEPPPPQTAGLDLSPELLADSTASKKDLRVKSTGARWPLIHLPLNVVVAAARHGSYGTYLKRAGGAVEGSAVTCFALDERLPQHVSWLRECGVSPSTQCSIYALVWPGLLRGVSWCHLATAHI